MYFNDKRWFIVGAQQCVFHVIVIGRKNIKIISKRNILLPFFSFVLPWFFKRTRFAFQKGSFCIPKGLLLPGKRTRFAMQKDPFWKSVGFQVKSEKGKVKNPMELLCCIIPFCRMPLKSMPNSIYYRKMKKNSRKSFVFAKNFLPLHPQSS